MNISGKGSILNQQIDLSIDGVDPVSFQIIKHRLTQIVDEAVEALKRVSGTANTNEAHDLMVALYTPEGDLLAGGVGFLHHFTGASEATKHVIEYFGAEISEGDVFILNDPYTAAFHPPDVYIIKPIFHEGELKAFGANFVHVADVGSVDPGGFSPNSTSVFHEGFQTPGMKLIEEGEMRQDVLDTLLNMSRDPGMLELDLRSQIAATNVAEDRMRNLFAEFGTDKVESVLDGLIDQTTNKLKKRLLDLPDGEWEARQYIDSVPDNRLFKIQVTLRKQGDSLTFDFSGTDEESDYGLNCTRIATLGGVLAPMFPLMCHDMTWNDGIIQAVDIEAPSGTIVNAERPAPISIATVATLQVCNCLSTLTISKMMGSSDKYQERATAVWHGAHTGYIVESTRGGTSVVDIITDTYAGAGGAKTFEDGIDLAGEVVNIVSRWANAERHESDVPLVYLYRRKFADSGGAGEYRGGLGHEYAIAPVSGEFDDFKSVTFGRGHEVPMSTGLFGGYPGSTVEYLANRDTAVFDNATDFPPQENSNSTAESDDAVWGVTDYEAGDYLHVRNSGSGGIGDPLNRDPDRVRQDVVDGAVTPTTAEEVYGVPVSATGQLTGDVESKREEIRKTRLSEGHIPDDTIEISVADAESTGLQLSPSLPIVETDAGPIVICRSCGTGIASAEESWKDRVVVRRRGVSAAGTRRNARADIELREFACPECATLLDTEVARSGDPFLESRLL